LQIPCQKHNLKPILTDYIYRIIPSKNQKSKPWEMDLPLLKNDITGSEPLSRCWIHCRYMEPSVVVQIGSIKSLTLILSSEILSY